MTYSLLNGPPVLYQDCAFPQGGTVSPLTSEGVSERNGWATSLCRNTLSASSPVQHLLDSWNFIPFHDSVNYSLIAPIFWQCRCLQHYNLAHNSELQRRNYINKKRAQILINLVLASQNSCVGKDQFFKFPVCLDQYFRKILNNFLIF